MYFIPTHAPPPVYDGSPLSEGALDTKRYPLSFICFLLIGKASFEPRDYRVVFGLQQKGRSRKRTAFFFTFPRRRGTIMATEKKERYVHGRIFEPRMGIFV